MPSLGQSGRLGLCEFSARQVLWLVFEGAQCELRTQRRRHQDVPVRCKCLQEGCEVEVLVGEVGWWAGRYLTALRQAGGCIAGRIRFLAY